MSIVDEMTQDDRRVVLIQYLLEEHEDAESIPIPFEKSEQEMMLRGLLNIRRPDPTPSGFIEVQDAYLTQRTLEKGIMRFEDTRPFNDAEPHLRIWRGDITTLEIDAIVNAANSQMLGCFQPGHHCIDNAIHTFAGVQLRLACNDLMVAQGHEEPTGHAKITPAFNLPSKHVIHTVGPIVQNGHPNERDCDLLASCYKSCLDLAVKNGLKSIAFCAISTGVFGFPKRPAAEIAIGATREFLREKEADIDVVFNVFDQESQTIYLDILSREL